jgi:hypothetical protein
MRCTNNIQLGGPLAVKRDKLQAATRLITRSCSTHNVTHAAASERYNNRG